jgi:hypothetical protein
MSERDKKQAAADVQRQPEEQQRDAGATIAAPAAGPGAASTETMARAMSEDQTGGTAALTGAAARAGRETERGADAGTARDTPLFGSDESEKFRRRWTEMQTSFVDEPRRAVEQADGLVAEVIQRLAQVFADERGKLEQQWDRGGDIDTEQLRISLQRYRSFFERLLSA